MSRSSTPDLDVAIVGAGPYGLSIAAHLRTIGISYRIFGQPMLSWQNHMPRGMFLKSEGFASNLYDPTDSLTLSNYCAEAGLPYNDIGDPVPLKTFVAYGLAFQQRLVPELEQTNVQRINEISGGFEIATAIGETLRAREVVVAAGISHFAYLPPVLSGHSTEFVTHSYEHADLSRFRDCAVAVIGGGASAVDIAAGLHDAGADVTLIARRDSIAFHDSSGPRSLVQRFLAPRSGLGLGWRSWLCTNAPLVFHSMPAKLRIRAVERHLGPAPGWFMKDRVVGRFPILVGCTINDLKIHEGRARLTYGSSGRADCHLTVDHVIGATGYRVDLDRLTFIDDPLRSKIKRLNGSPILDRSFESSVRGFYFTGVASANSFGPLMRFAFGAKVTSRRLTKRLRRRGRTRTRPIRAFAGPDGAVEIVTVERRSVGTAKRFGLEPRAEGPDAEAAD
jgi:hypothetical protein